MTHPLASVPLTYDGTDLNPDDYRIFFEIVSGRFADGLEVRGKDVTVPSLAGRSARNRIADARRIELRGHVRGHGDDVDERREDYLALMDALAILFDPTRSPAALIATVEDGSQRSIDARPLPAFAVNEQVPSEFAYVSVVLESVDPDWSDVGS